MNIEEICKLDRLRDLKVFECGNIIVKEKGIIDEMLRQSYQVKKLKTGELGLYEFHKDILLGLYIVPTQKKEGWHNYFLSCSSVYAKGWKRNDDNRNLKLEGLLIGIQNLIKLAEGEFNSTLKRNFNFEVHTLDDFKRILSDKKLGKRVCSYLISVIKNEPRKKAEKGLHEEYVFKRKQKNNVYAPEITRNYFSSLDAELEEDDEDRTLYNVLKFYDDDPFKYENVDSIFKLLNDDKDNILLDNQIEFFRRRYVEGESKYKQDNASHYNDSMRKRLEKDMENNRYIQKKGNTYYNKKDITSMLEDILLLPPLESFKKLCYYLKNVENKSINIIVNIVYSLDPKYYKPIVKYINNNTMEEKYIENKYGVVYNALRYEYDFQCQNRIKTYNYNATKEEEKDKRFIKYIEKKIMQGKKKNFLAYYSNPFFPNRVELFAIMKKIYGESDNDFFKLKMKEIGYKISQTTKQIDGKKYGGLYITNLATCGMYGNVTS